MTAPALFLTRAAEGWMLAAVLMALLWLVQRRTGNAGIVDIGWTATVAGLSVLYLWMGGAWNARHAALGGMLTVWGTRLAWYLFVDRVHGKPEDGRYVDLRRQWGADADRRLFWFFQTQAAAAVFFAVPALLSSMDPHPSLRTTESVAMALWVLATIGEASADATLVRFKRDRTNHGLTCRTGWWRYSRHPNYFFEWLIWVAYALFASASPWGALAFACPAGMLYLLMNVTGIPLAEAQALRTRGDDYARYQRTTSVFVPLPEKR